MSTVENTEPTPRDLTEVITAVLELIPETEQQIRSMLGNLRETAFFAPPEGMGALWSLGTEYLIEELGEPTTPWKVEVARVWSGR
jgi:hypothetical protein